MAVTINGTTGIETNTDTGKIKVGIDDDLIIEHNGSHSYITQDGTGWLVLSSDNVQIANKANTEAHANFNNNGSVELFHNGTKKFETLAGGAKVNSSAAATAEFGIQATSGQNAELWLLSDAGNQYGDKVRLLQDDGVLSTQFNTAADTWENAIICTANGAVDLYHNNVKTFNTCSTGMELRAGEGGDCELYMYADEGDDNTDLWKFVTSPSVSQLAIQNKASGSWENSLIVEGNGAAKLYHDNAKRLETYSEGVWFTGSVTPSVDDAYHLGKSSHRWDNIWATNSTINTSDRNEKNTIVDSDLGLSFVNKLKPVSYKFNGKTRTHYGLIAQDVETTLDGKDFAGFIKEDLPDELYTEGDDLPEGKKVGDVKKVAYTTYGLRYNEFISPLVKAVQELSTEVETLKTKVAALEAA